VELFQSAFLERFWECADTFLSFYLFSSVSVVSSSKPSEGIGAMFRHLFAVGDAHFVLSLADGFLTFAYALSRPAPAAKSLTKHLGRRMKVSSTVLFPFSASTFHRPRTFNFFFGFFP